jgi:hypothetical protein
MSITFKEPVTWVPCHYAMAGSMVADRENAPGYQGIYIYTEYAAADGQQCMAFQPEVVN